MVSALPDDFRNPDGSSNLLNILLRGIHEDRRQGEVWLSVDRFRPIDRERYHRLRRSGSILDTKVAGATHTVYLVTVTVIFFENTGGL
jgi:hypothetical protein